MRRRHPSAPRFPRLAPIFFGDGLLVMVAFAVLAFVPPARAGTVEDLDRENGLPDLKLGTPVEAVQGLEIVEETGRWTSYRRATDKMTLGKYELAAVTYNFFKGKLYSIFMDVEGKRNTRGVLKTLEATYGRDHTFETRTFPKSDAVMETREWTGRKVYLIYKSGADGAGGQITLLDRPAWDLLQVPKQEQAAELRKKMQGSFLQGDF